MGLMFHHNCHGHSYRKEQVAWCFCDDSDAPMGTWVHWVLYGLSPDTLEIAENIPDDWEVLGGAKHGVNDFHKYGYGGPCPPGGTHTTIFSNYMQWIQWLIWILGRQRMKFLTQLRGMSWHKDNLWADTVDRCNMSIPLTKFTFTK